MHTGTAYNLLRFRVLLLVWAVPVCLVAQYNKHWVFTDRGNAPPYFGGSTIRFEKDSLVIHAFQSSIGSCDTNVSISDSLGNLLFYSNGCEVFGANHLQLMGGDGLGGPRGAIDRKCMGGINANFRQGIVAIPTPGAALSFYIFYLNVYDALDLDKRELLYARVEFPEGFSQPGKVVEKNIFVTESVMRSIAAIRHANGRDWWVMAARENGELDAWLVDPHGISNTAVTTDLGFFEGEATVFSPDGKWFAQMGGPKTRLLCFDRCSGLFSCEYIVQPHINPLNGVYGVAFSPSSRFLYISDLDEVHQLDLHDPKMRYTKIATMDSFLFQGFTVNFYRPQLGPDGKIYINNSNGSWYLHVIESPDSLGLACNFRQRAVQLPNLHLGQMPYFAVDPGPQPYSACDTLPHNGMYVGAAAPPSQDFLILPNPVHAEAFVSISGCTYGELRVFDALGREVIDARTYYRGGQQLVDFSHLNSGTYHAVLYQNTRDIVHLTFIKI